MRPHYIHVTPGSCSLHNIFKRSPREKEERNSHIKLLSEAALHLRRFVLLNLDEVRLGLLGHSHTFNTNKKRRVPVYLCIITHGVRGKGTLCESYL